MGYQLRIFLSKEEKRPLCELRKARVFLNLLAYRVHALLRQTLEYFGPVVTLSAVSHRCVYLGPPTYSLLRLPRFDRVESRFCQNSCQSKSLESFLIQAPHC